MHIFYSKLFIILLSLLLYLINIYIFLPVLNSNNLIFPYSIKRFDIVQCYPMLWQNIKLIYYITSYFSILIIINSLLNFKNKKTTYKSGKNNMDSASIKPGLNLLVGKNSSTQENVYIPENALYQNILVTGTIGSR